MRMVTLSETMLHQNPIHIQERGYSIHKNFIENRNDGYNKGRSYWEFQGDNQDYSITARVSRNVLTMNSCFKGFSNMNGSLNPKDSSSVIVIMFMDNI